MKCHQCHQTIPADAAFCIYCAAPAKPAQAPPPVMDRPVTGPTVRLDTQPAAHTVTRQSRPQRVVLTQTAHPVISQRVKPRRKRNHHLGLLFMIGLVVLFLTNTWWPGILVLFGLFGFIKEGSRRHHAHALAELVFWLGLAYLFRVGIFFPGIFVLLLITHILRKQPRISYP